MSKEETIKSMLEMPFGSVKTIIGSKLDGTGAVLALRVIGGWIYNIKSSYSAAVETSVFVPEPIIN